MKKVCKSVLLVVIVSLTIVPSAFAAYIDPNTGGLLFQMLAVIFGLLSGFVLFFSAQIKMLFARAVRSIREKRSGQSEVEEGAE